MISPPCTALCCPISSVSHFSWSPFVRQPPIMEQCHITGWAPAKVRRLYEMYTSNPTRTTHQTPSASFRAFHEQLMEGKLHLCNISECCGTTSPPGGSRCRYRRSAEALLSAASALLSLSSQSLVLSMKSTADLGQILHPERAFKTLQILFRKQMVLHLSGSLSRKQLLCLWV